MDRSLIDEILAHLDSMPDRRHRRDRVYSLASLWAILLFASVADYNTREDMADFVRQHAGWFRQLGIVGERLPSAQTLRRQLQERDTNLMAEWQSLLTRFRQELDPIVPTTACAKDGKTIRWAADPARQEPGSHIVSVQLDNGLVVAQREVQTKDNELTALRSLLPTIDLARRDRQCGRVLPGRGPHHPQPG